MWVMNIVLKYTASACFGVGMKKTCLGKAMYCETYRCITLRLQLLALLYTLEAPSASEAELWCAGPCNWLGQSVKHQTASLWFRVESYMNEAHTIAGFFAVACQKWVVL